MRRRILLLPVVLGAAALAVAVGLSVTHPRDTPAVVAAARVAPAGPGPEFSASDLELAFDPQLDDAALIRAVTSVVYPSAAAPVLRTPITAVHTDVEHNVACVTLDRHAGRESVESLLHDLSSGTLVTEVRIKQGF